MRTPPLLSANLTLSLLSTLTSQLILAIIARNYEALAELDGYTDEEHKQPWQDAYNVLTKSLADNKTPVMPKMHIMASVLSAYAAMETKALKKDAAVDAEKYAATLKKAGVTAEKFLPKNPFHNDTDVQVAIEEEEVVDGDDMEEGSGSGSGVDA